MSDELAEIRAALTRISETLAAHGVQLATLLERTAHHEKRLDRADAKSTGLGAVAGLVGGFLGSLFKPAP